MKFRKPLLAATTVAALFVGGAGVASAQYGDTEPAPEPTVEVQETNPAAVQVQETEGESEAEESNDGRRRGCGKNHEAAAEAIGISVEELQAALEDGSTIADVATDNGVDVQDVIDALVANAEERLDAKVEEGRLTADEAAEKLERKTEKITNRVNGIDDDAEEVTA